MNMLITTVTISLCALVVTITGLAILIMCRIAYEVFFS